MTVRQPGRQSTAARVGEVIAADSTSFTVQCYELYGSPPLGSFIRAGHPGIYGVVNNVRTEPLDPSRPVLARGRDHETEDEVLLENPQLSRLLTSRFDAVTIGAAGPSGFAPWLPPLPPAGPRFRLRLRGGRIRHVRRRSGIPGPPGASRMPGLRRRNQVVPAGNGGRPARRPICGPPGGPGAGGATDRRRRPHQRHPLRGWKVTDGGHGLFPNGGGAWGGGREGGLEGRRLGQVIGGSLSQGVQARLELHRRCVRGGCEGWLLRDHPGRTPEVLRRRDGRIPGQQRQPTVPHAPRGRTMRWWHERYPGP